MSTKKPYGPEVVPKIPAGPALQLLGTLRNAESLERLHRVHLSIVLNMAGLTSAAVFRVFSTPSKPKLYLTVIGGVTAAILNWFWSRRVVRNDDRLGYWNSKIEELERVCGIEGGVAIYTAPEYQVLRTASLRSRVGWRLLVIGFIVMWVWISFLALLAALLK